MVGTDIAWDERATRAVYHGLGLNTLSGILADLLDKRAGDDDINAFIHLEWRPRLHHPDIPDDDISHKSLLHSP